MYKIRWLIEQDGIYKMRWLIEQDGIIKSDG